MADTPWCGFGGDKAYLQSGEFTSTLKTSISVIAKLPDVTAISWDGANTQLTGSTSDKLFNFSGQFTSTIKDSQSVSVVDNNPQGISSDNSGHTPWLGNQAGKLYLTSGRFTSTLKDSESIVGIDGGMQGISYTGSGDTPWCGLNDDKFYMQSGQFTSTLKTSLSVLSLSGFCSDISVSDVDSYMSANVPDKLWKLSGQFTTTVKSSVTVSGIDDRCYGIENGDFSLRTSPPPVIVYAPELTLLAGAPAPTITGVDTIVTISAALGLSGSVNAPSFTIDAFVIPDTLSLAAEQGFTSIGLDTDIYVSLPALALGITVPGVPVVSADVFLLLPGTSMISLSSALSIHAPTVNVTNDVRTLVTNTRNFGISEYGNFGFNSMCKFNGKYLYAKSDGIFEGGGDNDNGTQIDASYKTGSTDFFNTEIQRLRDAYLTFRSNGDIQLFSVGDEIKQRAYDITSSPGSNIHERRVKFERGIRERHFSFGISNVNGSTLEVDSAKILSEPIRKRR